MQQFRWIWKWEEKFNTNLTSYTFSLSLSHTHIEHTSVMFVWKEMEKLIRNKQKWNLIGFTQIKWTPCFLLYLCWISKIWDSLMTTYKGNEFGVKIWLASIKSKEYKILDTPVVLFILIFWSFPYLIWPIAGDIYRGKRHIQFCIQNSGH